MRPEASGCPAGKHTDRGGPDSVETYQQLPGRCWDYSPGRAETLKIQGLPGERVGLAHGDTVFYRPDEDAAISHDGGGTRAKAVEDTGATGNELAPVDSAD